MGGKIRSSSRRGAGALLALLLAACVSPASFAEGLLQKIRDDVRGVSSDSPPADSPSSSSRKKSRDDDDDFDFHFHGGHDGHHDRDAGFYDFAGEIALYGVTSPWWAPHYALGDDLRGGGFYFPPFPYDHVPGYMMAIPANPGMKTPIVQRPRRRSRPGPPGPAPGVLDCAWSMPTSSTT